MKNDSKLCGQSLPKSVHLNMLQTGPCVQNNNVYKKFRSHITCQLSHPPFQRESSGVVAELIGLNVVARHACVPLLTQPSQRTRDAAATASMHLLWIFPKKLNGHKHSCTSITCKTPQQRLVDMHEHMRVMQRFRKGFYTSKTRKLPTYNSMEINWTQYYLKHK